MFYNYPYFRYESVGKLVISVFAFTVGKPISKAIITITEVNNKEVIFGSLETDISGKTSIIYLPAPLPIYSSNNLDKPFSEYDIYIKANGYQDKLIKNVQIYPNSKAEQQVFLLPTSEINSKKIINISYPTLWGNYPAKEIENPIKELPASLGFVVLPNPVVPEFVIVHAGPPSSDAPNYKVPFIDYIKNVACCELYSTWPKETLKANILAIISFTLNRVYTEWYISKGYNFTITGSHAYDQAYDHGRTIYEEISILVDTIFTTFITKPGIRQPLLAQYCDGKKSNCPNALRQWGSKSLGDDGFLAIDILKRYYGSDIFLMEANKVEGIPKSFNGENLQLGSKGNNVKIIQEQINTINQNYPGINKLKVNGEFDDDTRISVEKFQEVFDLPTTGIVDFATWYKISAIYVAVEQMISL